MKRHFLKLFPPIGVGLAAGLLNGLLGAGGGILILFGLRRLCGQGRAPRAAYVTAIAVILPLSLISALQYARLGSLDAGTVSSLLLPAVLGGLTGALLLRRLSPTVLGRIFAAAVLVSGVVMVI